VVDRDRSASSSGRSWSGCLPSWRRWRSPAP